MTDPIVNTDNLIFNPNDYVKKTGDIDLNELDDRYVNVVGDTMSHLNASSIQLYEQSTISFADNTIQSTAFNQDAVNNLLAQYNNSNQILSSDNTFTGINSFNKQVLFKKDVQIYDINGGGGSPLTIVQRVARTFYSNPRTGGTHEFWNQGTQSLILTNSNINMMNKPVIGVKDITFQDGTIQNTAVDNTVVMNLANKLTNVSYNNNQTKFLGNLWIPDGIIELAGINVKT